MEDALLTTVFERLDTAGLPAGVVDLVVAAVDSDTAVAGTIDGTAPPRPIPTPARPPDPVAVWLGNLTVAGFRGIGAPARLGLTPGPGLHLVVGRNGSGKSSFAEALELLLTGDTARWAGKKTKEWQAGWRNLHTAGATTIDVEVFVDGRAGPSRLAQLWPAGVGLEESSASVKDPGEPPSSVSSLGWDEPLSMYRPFLSYDELGNLLVEGPSKLYDAMAQILGLDDLVAAVDRLANARKTRAKSLRDAQAQVGQLRGLLTEVDGARGTACLAALPARGTDWDLDALATVLATDAGQLDQTVAILEQFASVTPPDLAEMTAIAAELRSCAAAVAVIAGTDADRALALADLLDTALAFHTHTPTDECPVCRTPGRLAGNWHDRTTAEVCRLRSEAAEAQLAHNRLSQARASAARILALPPLPDSTALDVDDAQEALDSWTALAGLDDPNALADGIDDAIPTVTIALQELAVRARQRLAEHQQAWWPIAERLARWLPEARSARAGQTRAGDLTAAETWLRELTDDLRAERFAPIAGEVKGLWEELSPASNVTIDAVTLTGTATRRRVTIGVSVDGTAGAALGVMSQGELHAMALSLFLPRATLPASPFRFIVIDDPVQAMDPARVDGLARVLARVAFERQVVVFSHDDRLADAVRRLQLPARILEVRRADHSAVTVTAAKNPITAALDDAGYLLTDAAGITDDVRVRVVPGLCRQALEAACIDATRRRRLGRGDRHSDVEDVLTNTSKLLPRLALALFDDPTKGGDVYTRVNNARGREYGDTVRAVNEGAHGKPVTMPLQDLVARTRTLATWIAAQP